MPNVGAPQDVGKKRSRDPSDDMIMVHFALHAVSFFHFKLSIFYLLVVRNVSTFIL